MNKSNKNNFKGLIVVLMFLFVALVLPFSSAVNDKAPQKQIIEHDKYGGNIFFRDFNKYKSQDIEINSDIKNTIDTSNAIFNKNYISVVNYEKKKQDSDYEIKFYTGNDNVEYTLYKSDLVGVSKQQVKETSTIKETVFSKDGYVYYNTSSFSTLVLSMPDVEIAFRNLYSIDLRQYFDDVDNYSVYYYDPLNQGNILKLSEGQMTLNTEAFELNLYRVGGNAFLDIEMYEDIICNGVTCNYIDLIFVEACNVGETNCINETMRIDTPDIYNYYLTDRDGLHNDLVFAFDMNENQHLSNGYTYNRYNLVTPLTINGASFLNDSGIIDDAYDFDGTNDNIVFPDFSLNTYSVSLWINPDVTNVLQYIMDASLGRQVLEITTSGTLRMFSPDITSSSITSGSWYNVVFTSDGTNNEMFLNGVSQGTGTSSVDLGGAIRLGSHNGASGQFYNGQIDEVLVFDDVLDITDVTYLYNSGFGRRFHTLNHPSEVGITGICSDAQGFLCGANDHDIGNLQIGTTTLYLSNYFSYPVGLTESFNVTYYNFDLSQFEVLQSGFCTAFGELYDLCLAGDQLNITFYSNDDNTTAFDSSIVAYNNLGYSEDIAFRIGFPVAGVGPPNQTAPLPLLTFNQSIVNDTKQVNINSYFTNYNFLNVTYTDNTSVNLYLERGNSSVVCNEGNIRVCLDGGDVSNNIIVNISSINNLTYNDRLTFHVGNSNSTITDFIDVRTNQPIPVLVLIDETLGVNEEYIKVLEGGTYLDVNNITNVFNNITEVKISFFYEPDNTTLTLNLSAITQGFDYAYWDLDENGIVILYKNYLLESDNVAFEFESKEVNFTQEFDIIITHSAGTYTGKIYIDVSTISDMVELSVGAEYMKIYAQWFVNVFPSSDLLTTGEGLALTLLIIIIICGFLYWLLYPKLQGNATPIIISSAVLMYLFFIGIGYITIGVAIGTFIVALALTLLLIRGRR